MSDTLHRFAPEQLLALCGTPAWTALVAARGPYADAATMHAAADAAFDQLAEADWLDAFAHHPRIGDLESLRERFAASGALSEREQAALADAGEDVVAQLAAGNEAYEQRFGFVFLIRAAGRTATELLDHQLARLGNDRATELAIAADQQREITHLRIDQAFGSD